MMRICSRKSWSPIDVPGKGYQALVKRIEDKAKRETKKIAQQFVGGYNFSRMRKVEAHC
jgi:hypothetical protein